MMTRLTTNRLPNSPIRVFPRTWVVGLVVLSVLLYAARLNAETDAARASFHLRFGAGIAMTSVRVRSEDQAISLTGPSVLDGVQLGGRLANGLSIFFEASTLTMLTDPQSAARCAERSCQQDLNSPVFGIVLGAGLGGRLTPADLYLSVALGPSLNNISTGDGVSIDGRNTGWGTSVMVGKDWQVGNDWRLGLAGQLLTMVDRFGDSSRFRSSVLAFGMLLTLARHS